MLLPFDPTSQPGFYEEIEKVMESDILLQSCVLTVNILFPILHEDSDRRVSLRSASLY